MIVGIILAAGKGTRAKVGSINKTALIFRGKPLICYGVELFIPFCQMISVVVGAYAQSVKTAVGENSKVSFVNQHPQMGTGHALKVAVEDLERRNIIPEQVLVGYGDHLMFYTAQVVEDLLKLHHTSQAVATLVSTEYHNPNLLGWGRVVRDDQGNVFRLVEHKDASENELKNNELNAGLYCFDFNFLAKNLANLGQSVVTGEYYLTDLIDLAVKSSLKVAALKVPFEYVGIGINTQEQVHKSEKLHQAVFKAR